MSAVLAANSADTDEVGTHAALLTELRPDNPALDERLDELRALLETQCGSDQINTLATTAESALRRLPPSPRAGECLTWIAVHWYTSGRAQEGISASEGAIAVTRAVGTPFQLWRALNTAGALRQKVLDSTTSLRLLNEAVEIASSLGDAVSQAKSIANIGACLGSAGQLDAAIRTNERAIDFIHRTGGAASRQAADCYGNTAWLALSAGDLPRALEAVERRFAITSESTTAYDAMAWAQGQLSVVLVFLKAGKIDRAAEEAATAERALNDDNVSNITVGVVTMARGLVKISHGEHAAGLDLVKSALDRTRSAAPAFRIDLLDAAVTACELAGQPDAALGYLHEILEINRGLSLGAISAMGARPWFDRTLPEKAAQLQFDVDEKVSALENMAITSGLRAGYDMARTFRLARLAFEFAQALDWSRDQAAEVALAARLCDIGMGVVPDELLRKPRGLSVGERKVVEEHTKFGAEVLANARIAILQPCAAVARFHHERWDGSGPYSLTRDGIPAAARVVALCDVFDALTHARPWRKAKSVPATIREIESLGGTHFDPDLTLRFAAFIRDLYWSKDDFEAYLSEEANDSGFVKLRAHTDRIVGESH